MGVCRKERRRLTTGSSKKALGELNLLYIRHAQQETNYWQLPDRRRVLTLRLRWMLEQALACHHRQSKDRLNAKAEPDVAFQNCIKLSKRQRREAPELIS